MNLKPVLQKTQCQFDHSCSSWYPGINKELKNKLRAAQIVYDLFLKFDKRARIGNELKNQGS